jgi:hypothetical protein
VSLQPLSAASSLPKIAHGLGMVAEAALIGAVLIVLMADMGGIGDLSSPHRS